MTVHKCDMCTHCSKQNEKCYISNWWSCLGKFFEQDYDKFEIIKQKQFKNRGKNG